MCGWPQWEARMVMQCQLIRLSGSLGPLECFGGGILIYIICIHLEKP